MWQPNPGDVNELVTLLRSSINATTEQHNSIYSKLEHYSQSGHYCCYLGYIACDSNVDKSIRQIATLTLKGNVDKGFDKLDPEVIHYLKEIAITGIEDSEAFIRRAFGSLIAALYCHLGQTKWPELFPNLVKGLNDCNITLPFFETTLETMSKILEDLEDPKHYFLLIKEEKYGKPLNDLVPILLNCCENELSSHTILRHALFQINMFLYGMPANLLRNINRFMEILFRLTVHQSPLVKQRVCQNFVTLLKLRKDLIMTQIKKIIQYMITATQDEDRQVGLEACEFWVQFLDISYIEDEERIQILQDFFPTLVPMLVHCTMYTPDDLAILGKDCMSDAGSKTESCRDDDIASELTGDSSDFSESEIPDEAKDLNPEDDADETQGWTLRKCAALAIDNLSKRFGAEMFIHMQPIMDKYLQPDRSWVERESIILCLGAMARGNEEVLGPYMAKIIPFLMQETESPYPAVRSTTFWTLSRFIRWIVNREDADEITSLLTQVLAGMLTNNRLVQKSASTALSLLLDASPQTGTEYLDDILTVFEQAVQVYHGRSLINLLDAISTFCGHQGEHLKTEQNMNKLIKPLVMKWEMYENDNIMICHILECFDAVLAAVGYCFKPYIQALYERDLTMIKNHLSLLKAAKHKTSSRVVERCLCILSSLALTFGSDITHIARKTMLPETLFLALDTEIVHMAISCISDLIVDNFTLFDGFLGTLLSKLITLFRNHTMVWPNQVNQTIVHNIVYCFGILALVCRGDMAAGADTIVPLLIEHLSEHKLTRMEASGLAVSIGQIASQYPEAVSPCLEVFLKPWCVSMRNTSFIGNENRREQAFM